MQEANDFIKSFMYNADNFQLNLGYRKKFKAIRDAFQSKERKATSAFQRLPDESKIAEFQVRLNNEFNQKISEPMRRGEERLFLYTYMYDFTLINSILGLQSVLMIPKNNSFFAQCPLCDKEYSVFEPGRGFFNPATFLRHLIEHSKSLPLNPLSEDNEDETIESNSSSNSFNSSINENISTITQPISSSIASTSSIATSSIATASSTNQDSDTSSPPRRRLRSSHNVSQR